MMKVKKKKVLMLRLKLIKRSEKSSNDSIVNVIIIFLIFTSHVVFLQVHRIHAKSDSYFIPSFIS
jgi:hypothetical protein